MDLAALRDQLAGLRRRVLAGSAGCFALIALNLVVFRGAGMVLFFAPFALVGRSAFRWRTLATNVGRLERGGKD